MHIRQKAEENELKILSIYATKSIESKGRDIEEEPCPVRMCFQRDRDRIIHSKAFRRLKHKTQVFFSPQNDHYRTRMTHTLEVSQIARTLSRALGLNEDLTEAIALGHDLGHTPFGHSGERVLNQLMKELGGFRHNEQSLRVVKYIEKLNLTKEVKDGILTHSWGLKPITLEGMVVQLADKIAYLNHDIEDAIESQIITENDLPDDCKKYFTTKRKNRLGKMINDVVENSINKETVKMLGKIILPTIYMIVVVLGIELILPVNYYSKTSCIIYVTVIAIFGAAVYLFIAYKKGLLQEIFGQEYLNKILNKLTFGKLKLQEKNTTE